MTKAYECDICGRFVTSKPTWIIYQDILSPSAARETEFDLCEECVVSLQGKITELKREKGENDGE